MQPRPALVTIYQKEYVHPEHPEYPTFYQVEHVPAKVWPVSMGPDEMLVEYDDGRLDRASLWDIRMVTD